MPAKLGLRPKYVMLACDATGHVIWQATIGEGSGRQRDAGGQVREAASVAEPGAARTR